MQRSQRGSAEERPICDYEGSAYRTDFWEGKGREYEDGVERLALRSLLPAEGGRLVDIGAGFGRLASSYAGYDEVILLDYSRSQLEHARRRLGNERFIYVAADIYHLPLATNAVDAVVMVRVLHHIANVASALEEIQRITRADGRFVLEFANKRHLKNILRYLVGRGINPYEQSPYEFAALHYDFHPRWISERLDDAGFAVEGRRAVSTFRSNLFKRLIPSELLVRADGALQRPLAPLALSPSMFVRARAIEGGPNTVERDHLFRCPVCGHEPLVQRHATLGCPSCHAVWPIEEGIYVFK